MFVTGHVYVLTDHRDSAAVPPKHEPVDSPAEFVVEHPILTCSSSHNAYRHNGSTTAQEDSLNIHDRNYSSLTKPPSGVWKVFTKSACRTKAQCTICGHVYHTCITSPLIYHVKSKHPEYF